MKWFKHTCDSLDDPLIYGLMEEFGHAGYVFFFGFLELYGKEYDHILARNPQRFEGSLSYLHRKLMISPTKIKKILSKIKDWETSFNGDNVLIYIPKFHELRDEYNRKVSGQSPDMVSGQCRTRARARARLRADKEEKKNPPTPLFSNGGFKIPDKPKPPEQTPEEKRSAAQSMYEFNHQKWLEEQKLIIKPKEAT